MDEKTLEVYSVLANQDLQLFFTAFNQILKVNQKRDFVLLCREDLQKVGLTSQYSVKLFENLLDTLNSDDKNKVAHPATSFNYAEFYINTVLLNQEPVIIGANDIFQEQELGSGNFGKVFKGSWQRKALNGKSVKVPVAIKTLTDGKEMSWKKEVSIFTALNQNHSNIIKFFGLLIGEEDKIKMVTEFAAYGSLLDRLKSKDITSISTLSQFGVQISTGMVYLHSRNLVHRDLSTRNILVTGKNQVKISDFGLSKVLGDAQTEWVMDAAESLPMRWLAPESLSNGVFTSSSDVWSFAVTLWEMFTFGQVPWGDYNNEQVKLKIQNGDYLPEPKFCPSGMYEVMKMCMNSDQHARPPFHIVRQELFDRQPTVVVAKTSSEGYYDLNFVPGDFITCIKMLGDQKSWLGQLETKLLFGRFNLEDTSRIPHSIPFSLQEEDEEEEEQGAKDVKTVTQIPSTKTTEDMGRRSIENKENLINEPHYQVPRESSYVNMNPLQLSVEDPMKVKKSPLQQQPILKPHVAIAPSKVGELRQEKVRPHSEVLSSRKDFFDLSVNFNETGQLKSGSDSKLIFKDTKPEIQSTVNDRIAKNMSAFLSFNGAPCNDNTTENSQHTYLSPVDVSSSIKSSTPSLDSILLSVDPYATTKSASCENLYEEIGENAPRGGRETQTLRPRPKSKLPLPEGTNGPSAYRKSSLDAYAVSVKKDFELLAEQLGPRAAASCDHLPDAVHSMNVSTNELQNYPSVKNTQYLQKFSSVIPVDHLNKGNGVHQQAQQQQQPRFNVNQTAGCQPSQPMTLNTQPSPFPQKSPDYYNNFLLEQKLNHFTYDPNASVKPNTERMSTKEKSRVAATNYTENDWDLFDDCVKGSKKLDKNRKKSMGKRISWPKNAGEENHSSNKEEFSDKFKKIRTLLPEASVSECLEGLRSSNNDIHGAARYIQILQLYRFNYGYSFEECERIFEECSGQYKGAEIELKLRHVKEKFQYLDIDQVKETLESCNWNTSSTLMTIFVQQCNEFGIREGKAKSIFNENQENVTKALEMAKIVRVAEITSKPEHFCFKTLTHCKWNVERAVNYIFSKS